MIIPLVMTDRPEMRSNSHQLGPHRAETGWYSHAAVPNAAGLGSVAKVFGKLGNGIVMNLCYVT